MDWLAQRASRSSRVVALGGGVVGDLAGFAAATFMRGVRLLQVPTSLMAMVDSSVGGKVGIDLAAGKNLAGAFWPPEKVQVPIDALGTLPSRHFTNGAAEVWKYAAIMDPALFDRLSSKPLALSDPNPAETVMRCIELKRVVVEGDEHETTGGRATLNFGHTVGHAIEQSMGYQGILHGEAVAIGMVAESLLGERLGLTDKQTTERIRGGLQSQGLPIKLPEGLDSRNLLEPMRRDKKADRNGLAFSLVSEIGTCKLLRGVAESDVLSALEKL
jgi:3-dehydroquinate synthase